MLTRGARLCHVVSVLVALVAGFLFFARFDDTGVQGATGVLRVSSGATSATGAEAFRLVEELAVGEGVVVGRFEPDLRDPVGTRHLYLAVGDPHAESASWLVHGYPAFTRGVSTLVHPWTDLGTQDAGGDYLVFGPDETTERLVSVLVGAGLEAQHRAAYDAAAVANHTLTDPISASVATSALLVAVIALASAVASTKAYGIRRLQGASWGRIVVGDLGAHLRFLLPLVAASLGLTAITLHFVNGWNQIGRYLTVAAGIGAALLVCTWLAHLAGAGLAVRTPLPSALKGEDPTGGPLVAAHAARVVATLLALAVLGSTVAATASADSFDRTRPVWEAGTQAVRLGFKGTLGAEQTEALVGRTGQWLAERERSGSLVLAREFVLMEVLGPEWLSTPSLLVNSNHLREQPVQASDGKPVEPPAAGEVLVVVPASRMELAPPVLAGIERWAGTNGAGRVSVRMVTGQDAHQVFTYSPQRPGHPPVVQDPVLVVVDQATGLFSPDDYMAFASQGAAVLLGGDEVIASARAAGVDPFVQSYSPANLEASALLADAARTARIAVFNAIAALAVLGATILGTAQVYTRRDRQRLFVTHISGWPFARSHKRAIAIEAVLLLGVVAWQVVSALQGGGRAEDAPLSLAELTHQQAQDWTLLLLVATALGASAGMLAVIALLTSQLVRTRSAED